MAGDLAASGVSLRQQPDATPSHDLIIKITAFEFDPEIRTRRSITSDNYIIATVGPTAPASTCVPITVFEGAGGILRATGYVDPTDSVVATILASVGQPFNYVTYNNGKIILNISASVGSRYGYDFVPLVATTNAVSSVFILHRMTGLTDEAGMIEIDFEIQSQKGVRWRTDI